MVEPCETKFLQEFYRRKFYKKTRLKGGNMLRKRNLLVAGIDVVMKLAKLGLDSKICHKCGRVHLTATNEKTLCNDY